MSNPNKPEDQNDPADDPALLFNEEGNSAATPVAGTPSIGGEDDVDFGDEFEFGDDGGLDIGGDDFGFGDEEEVAETAALDDDLDAEFDAMIAGSDAPAGGDDDFGFDDPDASFGFDDPSEPESDAFAGGDEFSFDDGVSGADQAEAPDDPFSDDPFADEPFGDRPDDASTGEGDVDMAAEADSDADAFDGFDDEDALSQDSALTADLGSDDASLADSDDAEGLDVAEDGLAATEGVDDDQDDTSGGDEELAFDDDMDGDDEALAGEPDDGSDNFAADDGEGSDGPHEEDEAFAMEAGAFDGDSDSIGDSDDSDGEFDAFENEEAVEDNDDADSALADDGDAEAEAGDDATDDDFGNEDGDLATADSSDADAGEDEATPDEPSADAADITDTAAPPTPDDPSAMETRDLSAHDEEDTPSFAAADASVYDGPPQIEVLELADAVPEGEDSWLQQLEVFRGETRRLARGGKWRDLAAMTGYALLHAPYATDTTRTGLLQDLARIYRDRLKDEDRAVEAFAALARYEASNPEALTYLSERYEARSDWRAVYELYGRAVEATWDPNERTEWTEMIASIAVERLDDLDLAIAAWEQLYRAGGPARGRRRRAQRALPQGQPLALSGKICGATGRPALRVAACGRDA